MPPFLLTLDDKRQNNIYSMSYTACYYRDGYTMSILATLPVEQQELIKKHLDLVIKANQQVNLTRIDNPEEGLLLHVEDSLAGLQELNAAPEGLYGDLGSGAAYPGIPLAIATGRKTMLIDSRQKKMFVMNEIIEELGLSDQVSTFAGRAELLARTQAGHFAALSARALAKLSVLLELASPLLQDGGHLICYKAHVDEAEIADAKRVKDATGMTLVSDRSFQLDNTFSRRILVFEKTHEAAVELPRLEGQAQKNPL